MLSVDRPRSSASTVVLCDVYSYRVISTVVLMCNSSCLVTSTQLFSFLVGWRYHFIAKALESMIMLTPIYRLGQPGFFYFHCKKEVFIGCFYPQNIVISYENKLLTRMSG